MGRFSSDPSVNAPQPNQQQTYQPMMSCPPRPDMVGMPMGQPGMHQMPPGMQQQMQPPMNWPMAFPKPVIGLDLNGVIIKDKQPLLNPSELEYLEGSLEAIKMIRLKGHKLMILSDQPQLMSIQNGPAMFDNILNTMMQHFGQSGIMSIDGMYYNMSSLKEDEFAKPNIGMAKRAENESPDKTLKFKNGWYVGDSIEDLKMAVKMKSKPILVLTGNGQETVKKLDSFANKELKRQTKIYDNLLQFANSL